MTEKAINRIIGWGIVLILIAALGSFIGFIIDNDKKLAARCEKAGGTWIQEHGGACWDIPTGTRIFNF